MKIKVCERDIYLGIFANDLFPPVSEYDTGRSHTPQSWLTQPIPSWTEQGQNPMPCTRRNQLAQDDSRYPKEDISWGDVEKEAVARMIANYLACDANGAITTCDLSPESLALSRVGSGGWTAHFTDWVASMRSVGATGKVSKGSSFVITVPYPVVGMNNGRNSDDSNVVGHVFVRPDIDTATLRGGLARGTVPATVDSDNLPVLGGIAFVAVYSDTTISNTADSLRVSTPYSETSIYSAAMKPGPWRKYKDGGGFTQSTQTDSNGNSTGKEKRATVDKCITRKGNPAGFAIGLGRSWFRSEAEETSKLALMGNSPSNAFQHACMEAVSVLFGNIDSAVLALAICYNSGSDVDATIDGNSFNFGKVLIGTERVSNDDPLSSRKALAHFDAYDISRINNVRFTLDGNLKAKVPSPVANHGLIPPNIEAISRSDVLVPNLSVRALMNRGSAGSQVLHPYVPQNAFNEPGDEAIGVAPIIRAGEFQKDVTRWNGQYRLSTSPVHWSQPICGIQGVSRPRGTAVQLRTADGSVGATVSLSSLSKMSYFLRGHALGAVLPTITPFCEDAAAEVRSYYRGTYKLRNGLRDLASNLPVTPLLTSESPTFFSIPGDSPSCNYKANKGGQ
jgi:hypothetical protein